MNDYVKFENSRLIQTRLLTQKKNCKHSWPLTLTFGVNKDLSHVS